MVRDNYQSKKWKRNGDLVACRIDSFRRWKMDNFTDIRGGGGRLRDLIKDKSYLLRDEQREDVNFQSVIIGEVKYTTFIL